MAQMEPWAAEKSTKRTGKTECILNMQRGILVLSQKIQIENLVNTDSQDYYSSPVLLSSKL